MDVLVVVDRSGDKAAPVSLELLTKARQLGGSVEAITWGDAEPLAGAVGAHGATALHTVGDLGSGLAGPVVAAAIAGQVAAGNVPGAILVPQTYDGRDIAGRLSARIDRPVLTNVVGLESGGDGLVSEHAIFGGTEVLKARFTASAPGIYVIRAKSFAPEESGGGAAAATWAPPAPPP
jgi:electron transfer flavoprotein alpha subunit